MQFIHIDDVVALYIQLINKINKIKKPSKLNYFPKGEEVTLKELIDIFVSVFSEEKFEFGQISYRKREVFEIYKGKSDLKIKWRASIKLLNFFILLKIK